MICGVCQTRAPEGARFCPECGTKLGPRSPAPPAAPSPVAMEAISKDHTSPGAATSHRFVNVEELGRGGMGVVYLADDTSLGRKVAIKRLLPRWLGDAALVERFRHEGKTLAKLHHPHIVDVYDVVDDHDGPAIVMEHLDGESLAQRVERLGRIGEAEVVALGRTLLEALMEAHRKGIVHRDIKPANVRLDRRAGVVKLVDWGIAQVAGAAGAGQGRAGEGSDGYKPPEQEEHGTVDARADLFALAKTLYVCLTGQPPENVDLTLVPPAFAEILDRALQPDPEARFSWAAEMLLAWERAFTLRSSPAVTPERDTAPGTVALLPEQLRCPECRTVSPRRRRRCGDCGTLLHVPCGACGHENDVDLRHCEECGEKLEAARRRKAEALRLEVMAGITRGDVETAAQAASQLGDWDRRGEQGAELGGQLEEAVRCLIDTGEFARAEAVLSVAEAARLAALAAERREELTTLLHDTRAQVAGLRRRAEEAIAVEDWPLAARVVEELARYDPRREHREALVGHATPITQNATDRGDLGKARAGLALLGQLGASRERLESLAAKLAKAEPIAEARAKIRARIAEVTDPAMIAALTDSLKLIG